MSDDSMSDDEMDVQAQFVGLFQSAEGEVERLQQAINLMREQKNDAVATVMLEIQQVYDFLGQLVSVTGAAFEEAGLGGDDGGSRLTTQDAAELRALLEVCQKLALELKDTSPEPEMIQKLLDGIETKLNWIDDVAMDDDEDEDGDDESEDEEGGGTPPALPSGHA